MFKLMQSPAYWWPVTVRQLAEDQPGELVAATFEVQFLRKTTQELQAWLEEVRTQQLSDALFVRPLLSSFRKVYGEAEDEVPFSEAALDLLLAMPGAASAITRAYFESQDQAAQKN